jgi:2-polyprenyl-3-methyl-5-hydroxy-6-metoxy-1,4-benzoquinol methylase
MPELTPPAGYYENQRPEVARLVPTSAVTILDVGCGKGALGKLLKEQQSERKVYGIEYVPDIAESARRVLDDVQAGDLQSMTLHYPRAFFDCMVFADILEHLADPLAVLRNLAPHLKPDGRVVCSIPNVRHYTSFLKILSGWEYDDYGLFDRTHLRFFSLKTMKQLLSDTGFVVEHYEPRIVASRKMRVAGALCLGRIDDFLAFQYLLRARLR